MHANFTAKQTRAQLSDEIELWINLYTKTSVIATGKRIGNFFVTFKDSQCRYVSGKSVGSSAVLPLARALPVAKPFHHDGSALHHWGLSAMMDRLCFAKPLSRNGMALLRSQSHSIIMKNLCKAKPWYFHGLAHFAKPFQCDWFALLCKVLPFCWIGFASQSLSNLIAWLCFAKHFLCDGFSSFAIVGRTSWSGFPLLHKALALRSKAFPLWWI